MSETVKIQRVRRVLEEVDYPISNAAARVAVEGTTVLYADGRESLAAVIGRSQQSEFETAADLEAEVIGHAPVEAVGEPGQSEGEG